MCNTTSRAFACNLVCFLCSTVPFATTTQDAPRVRHMPPSTPHSNSARRSVAVLQPFSSVLLHACLQEDEQADVWLRLLACCSRSTQCGSEASKKLVAVYKAQQTGELMHRMQLQHANQALVTASMALSARRTVVSAVVLPWLTLVCLGARWAPFVAQGWVAPDVPPGNISAGTN